MQDTGSGGSWPISTDRVVWFLGARHLLEDRAFANLLLFGPPGGGKSHLGSAIGLSLLEKGWR